MAQVQCTPLPSQRAATQTGIAALILIVSLFFLWGVANNLNDILIKQFKKAFELSDFQAGLVQSAFYLGYFLLAIPAGLCMRRFGYKGALLIGLLLYGIGAFLFYPAAAMHTYELFLLALFVIASGLAFLETSANPLITVLGPPEGAARRLNLAQSFNPMGSITGVLIGQHFIFSNIEHSPSELATMEPAVRHAYFVTESAAVRTPYLLIGMFVFVWALLIAVTRFPSVATADYTSGQRNDGAVAPLGRLFRNPRFMLAVVAQFFYVGAQVGVWSFLIRYAQDVAPGTPEKLAANYLTASLVLFMIGRFSGTALMRYLAPVKLLAAFAAINILLTLTAVLQPGLIGVYCLVASSFFMSIMFPTIFALGLAGVDDEDRKLGAPLIVMAIIGGAILTASMGALSDAAGMPRAMVVPALCFIVIVIFALRTLSAAREV
jgi:FHS family L-fucose permease-like MFS transporter